MKVLFITNIPSPYRVDFFNELGKKCELTVCYERESAGDRDTRWRSGDAINYTAHFTSAKHFGADKSLGLDLIREIRKITFDHLIITGYSSPSVMFAITYCRFHHIPYSIESDGGFFKVDHGFKLLLKKFLLCGAQAHFTTCDEHISYLTNVLKYPRKKIYKYPFTSLKNEDIADAPATYEEKKRLREELEITEERIVLSVGQFIYRKGYDILLDAANKFPENTGTYIIGGTPGNDLVAQKERLNLKNVHFIDFKQKQELKKWYRAADLFVLPTREDVWGLVVNEAMAQGLPVITTDRCIAGVELVNDDNGKLISVGVIDEITAYSVEILSDDILRNELTLNSIKKIKNYTFETMARAHIETLHL